MSSIAFIVPGTPVGKGRARSVTRKKKGGATFIAHVTPESTASYENLVKMAAHAAMAGRPPILGPVELALTLHIAPPASWSMKKQVQAVKGLIHPTSKPDIDNVLKAICDALNETVWKDDKQVVQCTMRKMYAPAARAVVTVTEIVAGAA